MRNFVFLLFGLGFCLTGCREAEKQTKSENQIPILAWYSIPPQETTLTRYLELRETGIT